MNVHRDDTKREIHRFQHNQKPLKMEGNRAFDDAGCFSRGSTCWALLFYDPTSESVLLVAYRRKSIEVSRVISEALKTKTKNDGGKHLKDHCLKKI
jgi:hypothetical protein